MIFCLHYLGCDASSISRVLESFDMGGSISEVEQYVEEEELLQHHEIEAPTDGQRVYTQGTGPTLVVDFAQGWPIQVEIGACWISALFPRDSAIVKADCRKIVTIVMDGRLRCCGCAWQAIPSSTQA